MFLQAQEETTNITLTDKQKADLLNFAQLSLGPVGIAGILGRKIGKGLLDFDFPTFEEFKAGATGK